MSEQNLNIELTFKEVELTKLTIQPGQTLAVTVKSDDIDATIVNLLRKKLGEAFPGVRVLLFGLGLNDEIKFTAVSEVKEENKEISACSPASFCVDCNCGKKDQIEGK